METSDNMFRLPSPLELWAPMKVVKFNFSLNEAVQLPKLQMFLLSAILKYKADVNALVDATNFSKNVIEQELHNMYVQKLLKQEQEQSYTLTELSLRLLEYDRLIQQMNSSDEVFLFNLITGAVSNYSENAVTDKPDGITANKAVSVSEINLLEAIDLKDIFLQAFPFLQNIESELEELLDNIVIEASFVKSEKWQKIYITHFPADFSKTDKHERCINIKNYAVQRQYQVFDDYFETNMTQMNKIKDVYEFDPSLLTPHGIDLLKKCANYFTQKNNILNLYEDPVSSTVKQGAFSAGKDMLPCSFDLRQLISADNEAFDRVIAQLPSSEFEIKVISEKIIPYVSRLPIKFISDKTGGDE